MRKSLIALSLLIAGLAVANPLYRELYIRYANAGGDEEWDDPNTYTALWEFETTNATQTLDTSGNGYNASNKPDVATGPTWTVLGTNQYGRIEYGYLFDGADDHFEGADDAAFNLTTNATISAWVKSSANTGAIMSRFVPSGSFDGWEINKGYPSNENRISFYDGTAWRFQYSHVTTNWTHVVVTVNGTAGILYVNGIQVSTAILVNAMNGTGPMYIGRDANSTPSRRFNGLMDNCFVINNVALSSNAIYELYQNTHPTNNIRTAMSYYNEITGRESLTLPTEIGSYKGLAYPRDNSKAEAAGWLLAPIVPFVAPEGHIIIGGTRRIEITDNVPYEIWNTETPAEAEAKRLAPLIAEYGEKVGLLSQQLDVFAMAMPIEEDQAIMDIYAKWKTDETKGADAVLLLTVYNGLRNSISNADIYAIGKAIGVAE